MSQLFTNRKFLFIHLLSVPKSSPKDSMFSYTEKQKKGKPKRIVNKAFLYKLNTVLLNCFALLHYIEGKTSKAVIHLDTRQRGARALLSKQYNPAMNCGIGEKFLSTLVYLAHLSFSLTIYLYIRFAL